MASEEPAGGLSALFVSEEAMDVAIAGANGIGKHHAKWFHQAGARVVGFLGRNEESVAAASEALRDICLLYTSPSPRDKRQSRMPSSA